MARTTVSDVPKMNELSMLAGGLLFPEGPAFTPDESLWLVELHGQSLVRIKKGVLERFHVGGKPNGIAVDEAGDIWFCDSERNEIRCFYPDLAMSTPRVKKVDGEMLNNPNDLAFDDRGNLVFTCPGNSRYEATGYVCVFTKEGEVRKIATGKYFPNGLAFTDDGKALVIAETYKHRLWKGDWDSSNCTWNNSKVFSETGGPIGPDGMAADAFGNLYVAVYGSGKIKVIDRKGEIIHEIPLPGQNPTNCAFDPTGKLGLVITEAEKGSLLSLGYNNRINIIKKNHLNKITKS